MKSPEQKLADALAFLGTKHVLHPAYDGRISHDPQKTNVARTVKRVTKEQADASKAEFMRSVTVTPIRRKANG